MCYTKSMKHEGLSQSEPSQNDYTFIPTGDMKRRAAKIAALEPEEIEQRKDGYRWRNYKINSFSEFEELPLEEQTRILVSVLEDSDDDSAYLYFAGLDIFDKIEESNHCSPLMKVLAKTGKSLDSNNDAYWYENELWGSRDEEMQKRNLGYTSIVKPSYPLDAKDEKYYQDNQRKLHQEFLSLPPDKQLVRIASDAAAAIDFKEGRLVDIDDYAEKVALGQISDSYGNMANPEQNGQNQLGIDNEALSYVRVLHSNEVAKNMVEGLIHLDLAEIPLNSQAQLLKFMARANNERFGKLCSVLGGIEKLDLRRKLLENFVAADFGEDFGDSLLTIAGSERLSNDEKEKLFDTISSCRESISKITNLYGDIDDGRFTKEYARAANERLTDAIVVFREIAENGATEADLGWAGRPRFNYGEAIEALELEAKSLSIISGVLGDVLSGVEGVFAEQVLSPDDTGPHNRSLYNFYSPRYGYVMLHTRPEGASSFDPMIEYGKNRGRYNETTNNVGVEASISFVVNPVDPFSRPNPLRPNPKALKNPNFYDPETMDKVSAIRLDREGRAPGQSADDPGRNPTNQIGTVSVDLAAIGDRADTPSGKIARLISTGNKIRSETDSDFSLNHNTRWFDQGKYGTSSGFSALVKYIDSQMKALCYLRPPKPNGENLSSLMSNEKKKNRKRGSKVTSVVAGQDLAA